MKLKDGTFNLDSGLIRDSIVTMRPRHIEQSLSEEDILYLQDIFLSKGLHVINLPNVSAGRTIIYTLLQALHYYHAIACLTCVAEPPLKKSVCDVNSAVHLAMHNIDLIEQFFTERFFADFLWIELTESLAALPAFTYAIKVLDSLAMGTHIPVIAFTYDS